MSSELAELFERDPLLYSKQDLEVVVKKMRENQAAFELGLRTPVAERKTRAKKPEVDLLKDLGL
jgi:hypothetical protein